ncbi:MAG: serine--tRNA ligase, partial [Arenimonas sp.]
MLDPHLLRTSLAETAARLKATRGYDLDVAAIESLESERKQIQVRTQELQNLRNTRSKSIGQAKAKGEDIAPLMAEVAGYADELKASELHLHDVQSKIEHIALNIPNIPHESVAIGSDESQNVELKIFGTPRAFDFEVKDHVALGERHNWLDAEAGAKLSGSRFTVLRGQLARLHRALAQFMLDLHTDEHGYVEMNTPLIVNAESMLGTTQLPKFEEDLFSTMVGDSKRYLIPTSEVPVTSFFAGEILDEEQLPVKFMAFSPCFRSEAGSYGMDTKGLIRQHQFHKVEMVKFAHPEKSLQELEAMVS